MACIPKFLIIGGQKCGTTAAARNLALHTGVSMFSGMTEYGQMEIEFYNQHWDRGIGWYASHFNDAELLCGEKTAELLHRKVCHERMFRTNPDFRLIVLLRSPVDRAYSQWKMAALAQKKDEPNSFEQVIERDLATIEDSTYKERFFHCHDHGVSCWREGYILKGMYADQLESVYRWFPKDQVFIGITEKIRMDMVCGYAQIFEFLGVKPIEGPFAEHFIGQPSPPMTTRMREMLSELYSEPNHALFSLLGEEVPEWL